MIFCTQYEQFLERTNYTWTEVRIHPSIQKSTHLSRDSPFGIYGSSSSCFADNLSTPGSVPFCYSLTLTFLTLSLGTMLIGLGAECEEYPNSRRTCSPNWLGRRNKSSQIWPLLRVNDYVWGKCQLIVLYVFLLCLVLWLLCHSWSGLSLSITWDFLTFCFLPPFHIQLCATSCCVEKKLWLQETLCFVLHLWPFSS